MTGFGAGAATLAGASLTIEIRAVNHRYLDLRLRVPEELPILESTLDALARERLTRGRFDVSVRFEGGTGAVIVDRARARTVFADLKELRDELAPGADVPLSLLGAVPELFVRAIERDVDALRAALTLAFDRAKTELDAMRSREGAALAVDLGQRIGRIRGIATRIAERAPVVVEAYRKRLTERVARFAIDAPRIEQEVVLFADKSDITEELTRLEGHCAHFEAVLAEADAVGRRLDFLLQELAREANTIGAKSQDLAIAHAVVDLKTEVERLREQVQNVE